MPPRGGAGSSREIPDLDECVPTDEEIGGQPRANGGAEARQSDAESSGQDAAALPVSSSPRPMFRSTLSYDNDRASVITISREPSLARASAGPDRRSLLRGHDAAISEAMERGHSFESGASERPAAEQPLLQRTSACSSLSGEREAAAGKDASSLARRVALAVNASLAANTFLLAVKIYAYTASQSKAILASAADSLVDIASQLVLAYTEYKVHKADARFPIGRTRLETVGVVACAVIMTLATLEVIQSAACDLWAGMHGQLPSLAMGPLMYAILGTATGLKLLLWLVCVSLQARSDSMLALAEDHRNDILSNLTAIVCGAVASQTRQWWWVDPAGAVAISAYIIWSWGHISATQVDKIVGRGAPEDFIGKLQQLASAHHDSLEVDVIRAYHFGARYLVEMEVILPQIMTVGESHDIALCLQHKVEAFDEVERAFVHVDYVKREEPEHKVERNLLRNSDNLFESHDSISSS